MVFFAIIFWDTQGQKVISELISPSDKQKILFPLFNNHPQKWR